MNYIFYCPTCMQRSETAQMKVSLIGEIRPSVLRDTWEVAFENFDLTEEEVVVKACCQYGHPVMLLKGRIDYADNNRADSAGLSVVRTEEEENSDSDSAET